MSALGPLVPVMSDERVTIRAPGEADLRTLTDGRDVEFDRWLVRDDNVPLPAACIEVDGRVVGWVDYDTRRPWLEEREVNIGYFRWPTTGGTVRDEGRATAAATPVVSHPVRGGDVRHSEGQREITGGRGASWCRSRAGPWGMDSISSCVSHEHSTLATITRYKSAQNDASGRSAPRSGNQAPGAYLYGHEGRLAFLHPRELGVPGLTTEAVGEQGRLDVSEDRDVHTGYDSLSITAAIVTGWTPRISCTTSTKFSPSASSRRSSSSAVMPL